MILTYMCSEQLWDKQYQITNQYLDRFSRNLYFVALGVGVSVFIISRLSSLTLQLAAIKHTCGQLTSDIARQ